MTLVEGLLADAIAMAAKATRLTNRTIHPLSRLFGIAQLLTDAPNPHLRVVAWLHDVSETDIKWRDIRTFGSAIYNAVSALTPQPAESAAEQQARIFADPLAPYVLAAINLYDELHPLPGDGNATG